MELGLCLNSGFSGAKDLDVDAHCQRKRFIVRADEKLTTQRNAEDSDGQRLQDVVDGTTAVGATKQFDLPFWHSQLHERVRGRTFQFQIANSHPLLSFLRPLLPKKGRDNGSPLSQGVQLLPRR